MSGKATLVESFKGTRKFTGNAAWYRLDPPLKHRDNVTEYADVIVSATFVLGDPETYIFPATLEGEIADWGELKGSQKGTLRHADALRDAGYEIVA